VTSQSKLGAEVIVTGKATAKTRGPETVAGMQFMFADADVELKAIRGDNANILTSETAHDTRGAEGRRAAAKQALERAGKKAADETIEGIIKKWARDVNVGSDVKLTVSGIGYRDFRQLQKFLKALDTVSDVNQRGWDGGVGDVDVRTTLRSTQLADILMEVDFVRLDVVRVEQNRIELKKAE
jgi:hypothetical protein